MLSKELENRGSLTFHFFLTHLLPLRHRGGPLAIDAHDLSRERRAISEPLRRWLQLTSNRFPSQISFPFWWLPLSWKVHSLAGSHGLPSPNSKVTSGHPWMSTVESMEVGTYLFAWGSKSQLWHGCLHGTPSVQNYCLIPWSLISPNVCLEKHLGIVGQ